MRFSRSTDPCTSQDQNSEEHQAREDTTVPAKHWMLKTVSVTARGHSIR